MTWLSWGILVVLLVAVIVDYLLKYVHKDGRTVEHKRTRRILFGITIIGILAQKGFEELKDHRRSNAEAILRGKVDIANTNITKLFTHQSELLNALGTNSAVDPKLRLEILEHSHAVELVSADISELEQWKTDFKNEQAAAKQKEDAARLKHQISLAEQGAAAQGQIDRTWRRSAQFYNFIIRTLQETVQSIAKNKGDKTFSNYTGLPAAPIGNKSIHIANITTGTNLGWSFEVTAEAISIVYGAEVWLRIWGSCTNQDRVLYQTMFRSLEIPGNPGTTNVNAQSYLLLTQAHPDFEQVIDLERYQTNVIAWIRRFIAAHSLIRLDATHNECGNDKPATRASAPQFMVGLHRDERRTCLVLPLVAYPP